MTEPTTAWMLPPPEPYQGPTRCPACAGAKVTGEQYVFKSDSPRRLLVDEFCSVCDGCGRAEHDQCSPGDHVEDDPNGPADLDDEDWTERTNNDAAPTCPSCHGRRWWVAQGFTDRTVHHLRVACGCAEDLLVQAR